MPWSPPGNCAGPIPLMRVAVRMRRLQTVEHGQGIGCAAGDPDHAELVEPEGLRELLDVRDRFEWAFPLDEFRLADARPVRRDEPQARPPRLIGDVRRLVVRADQAVEEESRMAVGVAILADLELPAAAHDFDGVLVGSHLNGLPAWPADNRGSVSASGRRPTPASGPTMRVFFLASTGPVTYC